ncbi:YdbL family protein [Erythrobacter sp. NFXS35]|uniref:YdbL family protein n=1 Tax=Erythrobacter sp. NFXS35 TaxID=2818436 RepID=UPI0032DED1A4
MRRLTFGGLAAAAMLSMVASPAMADRDPAYAAARAAGKVGEQPDGYIGIVGPADPALQRVVDNINIKRKAVYSEKAKENKATIEAYALSAGCQAIARTTPGEKYRAPDGGWQTRTSAPPTRDARCP